jgi:hypothetical protein
MAVAERLYRGACLHCCPPTATMETRPPPIPGKNPYYISDMLHIIVIVAFVGVAIVCHMIGTKNTIYRE